MGEIKILVPLANGFEEIEAITIIDMLRRAGAIVVSAGLENRHVTGSHEIRIEADTLLEGILDKEWNMIVLPGGGKGVENLLDDDRVIKIIQKHYEASKEIGAICAAPRVLEKAGITKGEKITLHPLHKKYIHEAIVIDKPVVESGRIITGRSAGAAMTFSLCLIKHLFGKEIVENVEKGVLSGAVI
ncbi:MAG: DJ-1/PfpI family protein [Candidatus Marinimicrobia bacterium]|nr:DJ-1/PfpI family protein [Candidatus Neomarinimicrobiota bacterium]MDD5582271.1 DJ-1/PfpI family protein [Candidatus Neomarinimicrobiota bacterium]